MANGFVISKSPRPLTIVGMKAARFLPLLRHRADLRTLLFPVFRSRFWNSIYQITLSFAIGQPPTDIITAHNERHPHAS